MEFTSVGSRWEFIKGPCSVHLLEFIIVMEALSKRFDDRGLPWELLYADDLVLLADSEEDLKRTAAVDSKSNIGGKGIVRVTCREQRKS